MSTFGGWIDVHGAGAQRSDAKTGDPSKFPTGFGPQGDAIRIYNYIRLVRNVTASTSAVNITDNENYKIYPNPAQNEIHVSSDSALKTISIFNASGAKIMELSPGEKAATINIGKLSNGIYFAKTISENGKVISQKFMVSK
jgi:hypothetical protein